MKNKRIICQGSKSSWKVTFSVVVSPGVKGPWVVFDVEFSIELYIIDHEKNLDMYGQWNCHGTVEVW